MAKCRYAGRSGGVTTCSCGTQFFTFGGGRMCATCESQAFKQAQPDRPKSNRKKEVVYCDPCAINQRGGSRFLNHFMQHEFKIPSTMQKGLYPTGKKFPPRKGIDSDLGGGRTCYKNANNLCTGGLYLARLLLFSS